MFEIAAAGRPAILVPYPHATADHQATNARWMADAGAAIVLRDAELDRRAAARRGRRAARATAQRLARMADAARAVARPDAARAIAGRCWPPRRRHGADAAPRDDACAMERAQACTSSASAAPGMSGLALIAQALGAEVSRLRRSRDAVLRRAARRPGIEPQVGHDASHAAGGRRVGRVDRDPGRPARARGGAERGAPVHPPRRAARRGRGDAPRDRRRRARTARRRPTAMIAHALARVRRDPSATRSAPSCRCRAAATSRTPCGAAASGWWSRRTSPTARS